MVVKKSTIVMAVVAVVALVGTVSCYSYAFSEIKGLGIELDATEIVEQKKSLDTAKSSTETYESTENPQESVINVQENVMEAQPAPSAPVKKTTQVEPPVSQQTHNVEPVPQPESPHVPFTNEPVTPGDPASYIDTVGQCPFYEMAGPKGCYPPSDIECNADWSVCTPKEKTDEAN